MADLEAELQSLSEAEVRLALIRRQIEDVEQLIEETHDPRILNSHRRTLKLLIRTQQAFSAHRTALLGSIARRQEGDSAHDPQRLPVAPDTEHLGHTGSHKNWEQW